MLEAQVRPNFDIVIEKFKTNSHVLYQTSNVL